MQKFTIKVPSSTSNIGPGFDVLGLGLKLFLTINVTVHDDERPITIEYTDKTPKGSVSLDIEENLITKTALYLARSYGTTLPKGLELIVDNDIPLGRGLGSSGTAIVGGVMLANVVCGLNLPKERLLDYCIMVEGHPDNVAATLLGGFVASYLNDKASGLPKMVWGAENTVKQENIPYKTSACIKMKWSKAVKVVVVIPKFELATSLARSVLPQQYERSDVVYNLQRVTVLTHALGDDTPNPEVIHEAMQDKVHQYYRRKLIPGLPEILALKPGFMNGFIGACMSGAGPTVLVLATENFEAIGKKIQEIFMNTKDENGKGIDSYVKILDVCDEGTVIINEEK
ncbi:homoserine kinase [Piromyces finnis]|uniref:Homoserine kinase n=1 Tax=Piromyces finnis TaxID=1754191 RepID=A0A1Y1VJS2_9FUNG|nr:homoserine kinase [Piromyces finnis]|eukprot:ORX58341.1 homoserine kinase [Piromyces finnis]